MKPAAAAMIRAKSIARSAVLRHLDEEPAAAETSDGQREHPEAPVQPVAPAAKHHGEREQDARDEVDEGGDEQVRIHDIKTLRPAVGASAAAGGTAAASGAPAPLGSQGPGRQEWLGWCTGRGALASSRYRLPSPIFANPALQRANLGL